MKVLFALLVSLLVTSVWSWKNTKPAKTIGAGLISIGLLVPAPVLAREGASRTFVEAEKAMKVAYENFDIAKKSWKSKAQKLVTDNQAIVVAKKKVLIGVNADLQGSKNTLAGVGNEIQRTIDQVSAEIEALKDSTASAYALADEAAEANKRPSITADLFRTAQIGAESLADDESILKELVSIRDRIANDETLLGKVVTDLDKHVTTISVSEEETSIGAAMANAAIQGLTSMDVQPGTVPVTSRDGSGRGRDDGQGQGLVGAKLFKKGASQIDTAQKNTWTALKKVQVDSRVANTVQVDLARALSALDSDIAKDAEQVKSKGRSQSTNSAGKSAIKSLQGKISVGVRSVTNSIKKLDAFNDEVNNVYTNDKKKANAQKQRKIVNDLVPTLKAVANEMDIYESESKKTDALLLKGRQAGEKEFERFRSSYKKPSM